MAKLKTLRSYTRRQRLIGALLLFAVLLPFGGLSLYLHDQWTARRVLFELNRDLRARLDEYCDQVLLQLNRLEESGPDGDKRYAQALLGTHCRYYRIRIGVEYLVTEFDASGRMVHHTCNDSGNCWAVSQAPDDLEAADETSRNPDLQIGEIRLLPWFVGLSQQGEKDSNAKEIFWEGFSSGAGGENRWFCAVAPTGMAAGALILACETSAAPLPGAITEDGVYLVFQEAPSENGNELDSEFFRYVYASWRSGPEKSLGMQRESWSEQPVWRNLDALVLPSGQEIAIISGVMAAYPGHWRLMGVILSLAALLCAPLLLFWPAPGATRAKEAMATIAARVQHGLAQGTAEHHWPNAELAEIQLIQLAFNQAADEHAAMSALASAHETAAEPLKETSEAAPPAAFIQALHAARRQAREAEAEARSLKSELESLRRGTAGRDDEPSARLRDAIGRLALSPEPPAVEAEEALRQLSVCVADTLEAAACSVWRWDEARGILECMDRYACSARNHSSGHLLPRAAMPSFVAALARSACIASGDAGTDPRIAQLISAWRQAQAASEPFIQDAPPDALLAAPIRIGGLLMGMLLVEHRGGLRTWTATEEAFLLAAAQLAGRRLPPLLRVEAENESECAVHASLEEFEAQRPTPSNAAHYLADGNGSAWRQLVASSGALFLSMDLRDRIVYANFAAEQAYRTTTGALLGREFGGLSTGRGETEHQALRRVAQRGITERIEAEHRRADGQTLKVDYVLSPLQDEQGHIIGVAACGFDRTEVERRHVEAVEQTGPYRRLVDAVNGVLWRADAIGCIRYVNAASERIYGYTAAELHGRPLSILGGDEHGPRDLERFSRLLEGMTCRGYRTQHRRKDGGTFWVLVYAATEHDPDGRLLGAAGIAVPLPEEA